MNSPDDTTALVRFDKRHAYWVCRTCGAKIDDADRATAAFDEHGNLWGVVHDPDCLPAYLPRLSSMSLGVLMGHLYDSL